MIDLIDRSSGMNLALARTQFLNLFRSLPLPNPSLCRLLCIEVSIDCSAVVESDYSCEKFGSTHRLFVSSDFVCRKSGNHGRTSFVIYRYALRILLMDAKMHIASWYCR